MNIVKMMLSSLMQFWFVVPFFVLVSVVKSRWFKGMFGEFLVNRLLAQLPENEYTIIKDVTLPTETGTTQIDHIVVSKFGIFVVETKNMKGWIFGSTHQKQWTQKIYRHTSKFQNPLQQNYKHVKTLEVVLGCNPKLIHSLIVFIGDSRFKTEMPSNVTYARGCLNYIDQFSDVVMSDSEVEQAVDMLNTIKLKRGLVTNLKHRKHVREIVENKQVKQAVHGKNTIYTHQSDEVSQSCPRCGSEMVIRERKRGTNVGQKFWGCSSFPKCRKVIYCNE